MAGGEKAGKRGMGFWTCSALVIGNMVGSGVFLLPSSLAAFGGLSLFGWLVSSTGAVLLALTFARLARVNPGAGGPYAYTRDGFGSFAGYLCAWTYWKAAWIGNAAIAVTLVGYLRVFIPALADPLLMVSVAIAAIWLCTLINLRGIGTFSVVQNLLTILKLLPLLLVGILGWFHFNPEHLAIPARSELPNMGYAQAIATTAALTLWSFIGLESATVPADDVEDPRRTIPRATLFGTLAAAALYILSITAVQGHLQLNVFKPVIVYNLLESIRLLADGCRNFNKHCVAGLEPDAQRMADLLERGLMLVTALNPHIGYDKAAEIAKKAYAEGTTLRAAALQLGYLDEAQFDEWVRPEQMLEAGHHG
ncbi:amino acid permease [Pseudomonas aeruginosa]|nr:amino acid permease [Pseudomonas aeruginosa]